MSKRLYNLPSQLSGGEQQRVTIARAIANNPDILLLDEPVGDLDSINKKIILKLLLHLNQHEQRTLIMVTHDEDLKYFAHRVIHMIDGKINHIEHISADKRKQYEIEYFKTKINQQQQQMYQIRQNNQSYHIPIK